MKQTFGLVLLVALGLSAAGCGSAHKVVTSAEPATVTVLGPITHTIRVVESTVTLQNVPTGARIACKGWIGEGLKVPPRGGFAADSEQVSAVQGPASPPREMKLTRLQSGSVTVSCKLSK